MRLAGELLADQVLDLIAVTICQCACGEILAVVKPMPARPNTTASS